MYQINLTLVPVSANEPYAGIAMYALARTVRGIYRLRVYEYSTKVIAWMSDEVRDTGIDVLFSLASVLFVLFISQISNSWGISVHFFFLSCIISSNARIILWYRYYTVQCPLLCLRDESNRLRIQYAGYGDTSTRTVLDHMCE